MVRNENSDDDAAKRRGSGEPSDHESQASGQPTPMGAAGTSRQGELARRQADQSAPKSEDGASKSGGKKGSTGKRAVTAAAVPAAMVAAQLAIIAMFLKLMQTMLAAAIQLTKTLFAKIMAFIMKGLAWAGNLMVSAGTWVTSVVGGTVATNTIAVTTIATLGAAGGITAAGAMASEQLAVPQRDGLLSNFCPPQAVASAERAESIETDSQAEEQAEISYRFFAGLGMPDENIAGIVGNWHAESGIDSTSVETIFDEPYSIGPRKQAAWDANWDVHAIDDAYGNRYPKIDKVGIGLGQWTNGRNTLLMAHAESTDQAWYDIETQLGFMMTTDDPTRVAFMEGFVEESAGTPEQATKTFMRDWEGINDGTDGARNDAANHYMGMFGGWEADQSLADSILAAAGDAGDAAGRNAVRQAVAAVIDCEGGPTGGVDRDMNLVDAVCAEPGTGVDDYGYGGPIENVIHPNMTDAFLCGYGTWGPENDGELDRWHSYRPAGTGIGAGNASDHTFGAALDISITKMMDTQEGQEYGRDAAEWFMQNADDLGVSMVIYWERVWLSDQEQKPFEEWDQYPQAWCNPGTWNYMGSDFPVSIANTGDPSHNCSHRNHIHVSVHNDGIDHNR